MSQHGHIDIPRWKEFQHRDATRTDSAVTWIKDFTRQLSRDNYLDLTFHQRGILHGIRLEYARGGAHVIVADTRRLTHRLGARVTMRDLRALEQAGFIEITPASSQHRGQHEHGVKENQENQESLTSAVSEPSYDDVLGEQHTIAEIIDLEIRRQAANG